MNAKTPPILFYVFTLFVVSSAITTIHVLKLTSRVSVLESKLAHIHDARIEPVLGR